jgi:hypothetical protein
VAINPLSTSVGADRWSFLAWRGGEAGLHSKLYNNPSSGVFTGSIVPVGDSLSWYQEPGTGPTDWDTTIHRQDFVAQSNRADMNFGNTGGTTMQAYLTNYFAQTGPPGNPLKNNQKRAIRVVVYAPSSGAPANPGQVSGVWGYTVQNFAIVRISAVNNATTLTFEFLRWDASCGFNF